MFRCSYAGPKQVILISVVLLLLMLSGCSGGTSLEDSNSPSPDSGDPGGSGATGEENTDQIYVSQAASRTSGVAPLVVHFTAEFSSSSATQRIFHDSDFTWDFDDPTSGTWGTNGKPKNRAKGPIAAHVFETPGTYSVKITVDGTTYTLEDIVVSDPDTVFAGKNTTCVSDTAHDPAIGCPDAAARTIQTDDLRTITQYAGPGQRILLQRGSAWNSPGLDTPLSELPGSQTDFPDNYGPVTIGAYGACVDPDSLGICANAPQLNMTGLFLDLDDKHDWRLQDLSFTGDSAVNGVVSGAANGQQILIQRVKSDGFDVGIGWGHFNRYDDTDVMDHIAVVSCDVSNSATNQMYVGAERLALLGNIARNSINSHVVRVWQVFNGVISNNIFSGSSINSDSGRNALKLHGPGVDNFGNEEYCDPVSGTICLANRTQFAVVSDNVFGTSGPWPVNLGPQDGGSNEYVSDIIFERNRLHADYGDLSCCSSRVAVGIHVWASYVTLRNNIIDGTGSNEGFVGIHISREGIEPPPLGNRVYNNTIYRQDEPNLVWDHVAIEIGSAAQDTIVRNNIARFPASATAPTMISNASADLLMSHNLLTLEPHFANPDNPSPLDRDFRPVTGSPAIGAGVAVPVSEDFAGNARSDSRHDLGAYYYVP